MSLGQKERANEHVVGESELQEVLARHAAFWEHAEVERPLLWTTPSAPWSPFPPYTLWDGRQTAPDLLLSPQGARTIVRELGGRGFVVRQTCLT